MKCTIPEISWHNRDPVLSVHINPIPINNNLYRLASGGADCHVLIWQLQIISTGGVQSDVLSDLTRHQRAVNAVRWCPNGSLLASADDDANIILWYQKTDSIPLLEGEANGENKEVWLAKKVLRGHKEDVYDLCWSPDGCKLLSGSIDNTAILWDCTKLRSEVILSDHKGFVQGLTWDPKGRFCATISTDRVCRIFSPCGKHIRARISKGLLPVPSNHYLHEKIVRYFHDDTFKSFFRRMDVSPDGAFLVIPSGRIELKESMEKPLNATYLFWTNQLSTPVAILPLPRQRSTVAKFCPVLFELHENGPESDFEMPYRLIVAVGTDHDVIIYDTQQLAPFAHFHQIHYTRLTDLTWSHDGRILIASSTDGFCALISFDEGELGKPYVQPVTESVVEHITSQQESMETTVASSLDVSGCEPLIEDTKEASPICLTPSKPTFLDQWAAKTPKVEATDNSKSQTNGLTPKRVPLIPIKTDHPPSEDVKRLTPKRIALIPLNEKKSLSEQKSPLPKRVPLIPVKDSKCDMKNSKIVDFIKTPPAKKIVDKDD